MAQEDYYAVLGVDRRASAVEIKRAYRRLTLEFHPDRHPGDPDAEERFRRINQAYATLGDPAGRARYDASLLRVDALEGGLDVQTARDLIGNMFGDIFGTRRKERRKGRDLRYTLTVELPESVLGSMHDVEFEAPGPCDTCHGAGIRPGGRPPQTCTLCHGRGEVKGEGILGRRSRCGRCDGTGLIHVDPCKRCQGRGRQRTTRRFEVRVPPGTQSGAERIIRGEGEPGRFGGPPGDLRVTVNVSPHPWLEHDGETIRCELPVSVTEAALGSRVPVPTVDGPVHMELPSGTATGTKLRLRGKGVPGPRGRGDQIVTVVVETPTLAEGPMLQRLEGALGELERVCSDAGALKRRSALRADLERSEAGGADPTATSSRNRG